MTSDLNVTSISRNASSSTNPNTSGAVVFIWASKSRVWAVIPVTATSVSSREPTVAGTMSSRSASRAALEGPSLPFPATGMETTATVPSGLTLTSTGWFITSVPTAASVNAWISAWTSGDSTSAALTTTAAEIWVPGNAASSRL